MRANVPSGGKSEAEHIFILMAIAVVRHFAGEVLCSCKKLMASTLLNLTIGHPNTSFLGRDQELEINYR